MWESCIKVTVFICGWYLAISSKSTVNMHVSNVPTKYSTFSVEYIQSQSWSHYWHLLSITQILSHFQFNDITASLLYS